MELKVFITSGESECSECGEKLEQEPGDDMVLELAVTANCHYIVTYNIGDFKPDKKFGITTITPKEFLIMIGEI